MNILGSEKFYKIIIYPNQLCGLLPLRDLYLLLKEGGQMLTLQYSVIRNFKAVQFYGKIVRSELDRIRKSDFSQKKNMILIKNWKNCKKIFLKSHGRRKDCTRTIHQFIIIQIFIFIS
jgi:hypothetical protein